MIFRTSARIRSGDRSVAAFGAYGSPTGSLLKREMAWHDRLHGNCSWTRSGNLINITAAFTNDRHYIQAGFECLLAAD